MTGWFLNPTVRLEVFYNLCYTEAELHTTDNGSQSLTKKERNKQNKYQVRKGVEYTDRESSSDSFF